MSTCEFNELSVSNLSELHKYLNLLLDNNLINKDDKIQKALYIVHPDRRINNDNITTDDYECATTIFNGYLNYLNEKGIQDKSIKYALELQPAPTPTPTSTPDNTDESENLINTFMRLSNIDAELTSEQIIARTTVLGEAIFGVTFDKENPVVSDQSPLPLIIGEKYDESQPNFNKLVSQFESYQYYTQLLVEFKYLLSYSFLLKQYSNEINNPLKITNSGGKKKKSRKNVNNKNKNKNKKTKRNKIGGETPENFVSYSTFYSWITGSIGKLSGLSSEVRQDLDASQADIKFYKESVQNLEEKRIEFYQEYDTLVEQNKQIDIEINRIQNLPFYTRIFTKIPIKIDLKTKFLGKSVLENNLKQLWINQRDRYKEIDRLNERLQRLENPENRVDILARLTDNSKGVRNYFIENPHCKVSFNENFKITLPDDYHESDCGVSGIDNSEVNGYNKEIDTILQASSSIGEKLELQKKIDLIKFDLNKDENKIIDNCKVRNKLDLFYNYIISTKFLGQDKVDLFLNLCENKLRDAFFDKAELVAESQTIQRENLRFARQSLTTQMNKPTLEDFVTNSKYADNFTITPEEHKSEIEKQKANLLDTLTNLVGFFKTTIKNTYEIKAVKAEQNLELINKSFYENKIFDLVRQNMTHIATSGGLLILNTYGDNPFSKIASSSMLPSAISSFVYTVLTTVVNDPDTIPPSLDLYYLYLQIIIVAFITPNLLKQLSSTFDNRVVNFIITSLQFILVLSFIIMSFSGLQTISGTAHTYFSTTMTNQYQTASSSSWTTTMTSGLGLPSGAYIWEFFTGYLPKFLANNALLCPSYYLRDMVSKNGKVIIGIESWSLLGYSICGQFTNFKNLNSERKKLDIKARQELNEFVFDNVSFKKLINDTISELKASDNKEETDEVINNLARFREERDSRTSLSLSGIQAQAASRAALTQEQQTNLMSQQLQQQRQQQGQQGLLTNQQMQRR
jgi:hypothetical protein